MQAGQPGHHWRQHALVCTLAGLFCSDACSFPRLKQLCCCQDWVTENCLLSQASLGSVLLHASTQDHGHALVIHCCFSGKLKSFPPFRGLLSGLRDGFYLKAELAALSLSGVLICSPFSLPCVSCPPVHFAALYCSCCLVWGLPARSGCVFNPSLQHLGFGKGLQWMHSGLCWIHSGPLWCLIWSPFSAQPFTCAAARAWEHFAFASLWCPSLWWRIFSHLKEKKNV